MKDNMERETTFIEFYFAEWLEWNR
jgi:hypothetical protein